MGISFYVYSTILTLIWIVSVANLTILINSERNLFWAKAYSFIYNRKDYLLYKRLLKSGVYSVASTVGEVSQIANSIDATNEVLGTTTEAYHIVVKDSGIILYSEQRHLSTRFGWVLYCYKHKENALLVNDLISRKG